MTLSSSLHRSLSLLPLSLAMLSPVASASDIVIEERPLSQPSTTITSTVTTPAPASEAVTTSPAIVTSTIVAAPAVVVGNAGTAADTASNPAQESGNYWQLYSQLQQLQEEVAQLRGTVEEQTHLVERLQTDLRTRYTDLDQRLQQQQEQFKQPATPVPAAVAATAAPASTVDDEKKAYLAAYDTFRTGGPDKAIAPMLAFVKKYPDSSLTPGACYWLGEFYLNASKPDQARARQQFDTVLAKYPDNAKAPAALYKIASILEIQGKPDETRQKMQELVKRYPKSPEASLAETWLKSAEAGKKPAAAKPATPKAATSKPAANKR